jgi:hypothetical protein
MIIFEIIGIAAIIMAAFASAALAIYLYLEYAHPEEKEIPGSWPIRIQIIGGMATIFFLIFLIPFDIFAKYQE